ncbi:PaaI family thioesterase [Halorarius halobius]|uniref:PaaI family thioesterase n=1 Tax=Halorarius halobius TaxID=2962671 RepID=UPI0020CCEF3A|nr:PaaI family thioesterase [Halorarius halobius]
MDVDPDEFPLPPYYDTIGIEITEVEPGYATGRLPLTEAISASPSTNIAHGGAVASLADSVGYWAVSAANDFATTPTIDLRIDYLAPATDDMRATATVSRNGSSVGVVDVDVETPDDTVAVVRGVFKSGGGEGDSAWEAPDR